MTMRQHRIDTYKEGWQRVEFCAVCGAEGSALSLECVGIHPDQNQLELFHEALISDYERKVR